MFLIGAGIMTIQEYEGSIIFHSAQLQGTYLYMCVHLFSGDAPDRLCHVHQFSGSFRNEKCDAGIQYRRCRLQFPLGCLLLHTRQRIQAMNLQMLHFMAVL